MNKKKYLSFLENKKVIDLLIFTFLVFFILILFLLLLEFGIITNPLTKLRGSIRFFNIEDRCSIIAGQLIHSIGDEDNCKSICMVECEVWNMNFYNSEFKQGMGGCNECVCSCKD